MKPRSTILPFLIGSLVLMFTPSGITHSLRITLLGSFFPLQKSVQEVRDRVSGWWLDHQSPRSLDDLERQNEFLRTQVVLLHAKNGELASKLEAATGARKILSGEAPDLVSADVILSVDGSAFRETLVVSAGKRQGIEPGMLVLYHGHVVGRIEETGLWTSRVTLSSDPGFRLGAVSVPPSYGGNVTFTKRDVGIFEGAGNREAHLKWLRGKTTAVEGSYVVTVDDPLNRIPKGLILGKITGVEHGRGPYARVDVTPIVNPDGLEFVFILKPKR